METVDHFVQTLQQKKCNVIQTQKGRLLHPGPRTIRKSFHEQLKVCLCLKRWSQSHLWIRPHFRRVRKYSRDILTFTVRKAHVKNQVMRHVKIVQSSSHSSHLKYLKQVPDYFQPKEQLKSFHIWTSPSKAPPAQLTINGFFISERKIVAPRPTHHPTVVPDTTHVDKSVLILEAAPGGIKYFDKAAFPSYQPETEGPTDFAIGAASSKDHVRNQIARHGKMVPSSSPWATVSSHPKYPREVPKYPLYFRPEERLKTFCNWSSSSKPPPALMSSSGFFNSGMGGDTVRCFQCGVGLRDWTTGDDPLLEHMRNSEKCPFLLAELGPEVMRDMMSDAADDSLEYDKPRSSVTDASSARPTSLPFPVRTMEFETMEARLKSLKDLPTNVKQSHLSIAVAGFFFTGRDDLCRCFTCDGGLKNWNPQDDPMEEHAKHFPQCQYIKHVKGDEYIQEVQRKLRSGQIDRGATGGGQSPELPGKNDIDVLLEMGFPMDKIETTISKLRQQGIATPTLQKVLDTIV